MIILFLFNIVTKLLLVGNTKYNLLYIIMTEQYTKIISYILTWYKT